MIDWDISNPNGEDHHLLRSFFSFHHLNYFGGHLNKIESVLRLLKPMWSDMVKTQNERNRSLLRWNLEEASIKTSSLENASTVIELIASLWNVRSQRRSRRSIWARDQTWIFALWSLKWTWTTECRARRSNTKLEGWIERDVEACV